ncbi:MAG: DUF21 domain-containing protein [Planctomycetes bacterium]|nr:DUF21 domain-containing protein [Planctomycetota bacterium]
MIGYLLLMIFFGLAEGYFSGSETGAYCLNKVRLRYRAEQGWRSALILRSLLADSQGLICTTLVGTNICVYLSTAILTGCLDRWNVRAAELVSTACLSPVLLIFAEATPKNLFQFKADLFMYKLAPTLAFFRKLFAPVVWALKRITNILSSHAGAIRSRTPFTARRLAYFLEQSTHEGVLTPYQRTMAENVMGLGKTPAKAAMIPLNEVTLVPKTITADEFRELEAKRRHTRIPVYEGRREQIAGVVNSLDFFCAGDGKTVADLLRPPLTIPADLAIDDALRFLQRARFPMGIVVNEKKEAVGIVTIKDLVEEIVGELEVW